MKINSRVLEKIMLALNEATVKSGRGGTGMYAVALRLLSGRSHPLVKRSPACPGSFPRFKV